MRYLQHNTCTVTRFVACLGTSVFHVLQHVQRLIHQFVALAAVYIYHHAHAARIVLVLALVESFAF